MKLNHDCIRDLMLYLEENLTINDEIDVKDISLHNFSAEEICYTSMKLVEANYLDMRVDKYFGGTDVHILSLTWNGHQFLDNI